MKVTIDSEKIIVETTIQTSKAKKETKNLNNIDYEIEHLECINALSGEIIHLLKTIKYLPEGSMSHDLEETIRGLKSQIRSIRF